MRVWLFMVLGGWLGLGSLYAQVVLEVTTPPNTPPRAALYVGGDFNGWRADDPAYLLKAISPYRYRTIIPVTERPFSFKITRGSWQAAEGTIEGVSRLNRESRALSEGDTLSVEVKGWQDLPPGMPIDSLEIRVLSIPENTPRDARLFITGSFNSWRTNDDAYQLQLQTDSTFWVRVPVYGDTFEYKFTRGSWYNVEGRASGRARFNRTWVRTPGQPNQSLELLIASWEDLSNPSVNPYTIFWLMAAIQGLLMIFAIQAMEEVSLANRLLSLLLLLLAIALIGRVVVYEREIFQWEPKLILIPDLIYFLYGPIFLLYVRRLIRPEPLRFVPQELLHFLPFVIHLLAYQQLFWLDDYAFKTRAVELELHPIFVRVGGIALLYNLLYWWLVRRLIQAYQHEADHQHSAGSSLRFLRNILTIKGICIFLWTSCYLIGGYGILVGIETTAITDRLTDGAWMVFSLTVFLLGYYALKEPDIFRLPHIPAAPQAPAQTLSVTPPVLELPSTAPVISEPLEESQTLEQEEDISPFDEALKMHLLTVMKEEQPYLNPKLTLPELADHVGTNSHELSRTINQGLAQNFNDFVNSYRVEAFKQRVLESEYRNHTFLAVAMMVGFNSKTAFNRSFKKLTGQTPREYFKESISG